MNFEKTILVGIINKDQNKKKSNEFLDELEFLAFTAGSHVKKRFIQKIDTPNPKTFIGTGKINEILINVAVHHVVMFKEYLFVDDDNPYCKRYYNK